MQDRIVHLRSANVLRAELFSKRTSLLVVAPPPLSFIFMARLTCRLVYVLYHVLQVQLLVKAGASAAVKDRWGNTPADEARRVGARAVADFLSKGGAS